MERAKIVAYVAVAVVTVCFFYAFASFVDAVLSSVPMQAFTILGITFCVSLSVVIAGSAVLALRWFALKSRQIHAKDALYPQIYDRGIYLNLNEAGAQTMAALSSAKPSAGVVQKVIEARTRPAVNDPALIPGPAAQRQSALTAAEVVRVDPMLVPHWLFIGTTGSGKTSATYYVLKHFKRLHGCEFRILEPGGVNWGAQAAATTVGEIAEALVSAKEEMEARQKLLRSEGVGHVSELANPVPYLVLVVEEVDSVFDDLKIMDRMLRAKALVALRNIARMGRKAGICLVVISQSGTGDVLDGQVRKNLSNAFLLRCEHTTTESWRIKEKLTHLPPGMAYSVPHKELIQFDLTPRPELVKISPPDASKLPVPRETVAPVAGGCRVVLPRLERGCEPDDALAAQLRELYNAGWSKTKLCNEVWGYKDGAVFSTLNQILA